MEQAGNRSTPEPDKAAIDASQPGFTISADSSARVAPSAVSGALLQLLQRTAEKDRLLLSPLRLVLLTAELPNVVRCGWALSKNSPHRYRWEKRGNLTNRIRFSVIFAAWVHDYDQGYVRR
jgi:hypothetical protein